MIPKDPRSFVDDSLIDEYDTNIFAIAMRRVVQHLWSHSPCKVGELQASINVSVNSIAAVFIQLSGNGVLEHSNGKLSLTDYGRRWVLKNRTKVLMSPVHIRYSQIVEPVFRSGSEDAAPLPRSYRL